MINNCLRNPPLHLPLNVKLYRLSQSTVEFVRIEKYVHTIFIDIDRMLEVEAILWFHTI